MTSALVPKVPKHQKLTEILRRQLEGGELRPGDRLPSFAELRERYGISQATIERIYVTLEQDGLVVREQGRGTFVAQMAPRPSTGMIGVASPDRSEWQHSLYWALLLDGITEAATRHNLQALLIDNAASFNQWEKVEGAIVNGASRAMVAGRIEARTPCVAMLVAQPGIASVVADDYNGAYSAMTHLLELGHRRIAFLGWGTDPLSTLRVAAYNDALQAAGLELNPALVRALQAPYTQDEPFVNQGRDRMREWLAQDWRQLKPTALVTLNDHVAVGAIEMLIAHGIGVPQQVSVVGFDGTELYDYFSPKLTTIEVPLKSIGAAAAEILIRQINGEATAPAAVSLPTRLRIGQSTGPPPAQAKK